MEQTIEKAYISVNDVMQLIPVSRAQIYVMVKQNKIKHYRFGRKILFKREEVIDQIQNNTTNENTANENQSQAD